MTLLKDIAVINWRGPKLLNDYTGSNTRRIYLIQKIIKFLNPISVTEITIRDVDSHISKGIAFSGRVLEKIRLKNVSATLREIRFYWIDCDALAKKVENASLLVIDHIRGVAMVSRCRLKIPSIVLLHDYHLEFPYARGLIHYLAKYSFNKLIYSYLNNYAKLIITASLRDKILYSESLNNNKIVVYPNLYYPDTKIDVEQKNRDKIIINFVLPRVHIKKIEELVSFIIKRISNVEIRGINMPHIPFVKNYGVIDSREAYLNLLAQGHVGINMSQVKIQPGSNVKRYDYAIAGNVPFNYMANVVGEPLPREFAFTDKYDLVAKLESLDIDTLIKYGLENGKYAYEKSIEYNNALAKSINEILKDII
ncbi:MAG: hypothetical protein QW598_01460 [Pyrobaculum sp.]